MLSIYREYEDHEKNLSAQQYLEKKNPRLPGAHVHQERQTRHQEAARQGAQKAGGYHRQQVEITPLPGFPKHERLLKRADFVRISGQGQKLHTTNFLILWCASPGPAPRIGITVSGKVGNAVVRNRLK